MYISRQLIKFNPQQNIKFLFTEYQDLQKCDTMQEWVYAGRHNGAIQIEKGCLQMDVQNTHRSIICTLKLHQFKYDHQKDQIVGKHNLFIKNYIRKFRFENIHYFQEQAQISTNFVLQYQVFIQKTLQGLQRIVIQHERLNIQNRPRKSTPTQSIISGTFSDTINKIQLKGQNRFADYVNIISQNTLRGSQSKIPFNIIQSKMNGQNIKNNFSLAVQKTNFQTQIQKSGDIQIQQNNQSIMFSPLSPVLPDLNFKKLASQSLNYQNQQKNPQINKIKRLPSIKKSIQKYEMNAEKRKKLMQDFQLKKKQFQKKLNQSKQDGYQYPRPISDRTFSRSSSTRTLKSVRLSQCLKVPQQHPWVKKQKAKNQKRYKLFLFALLFFMIFFLYIVMQPAKKTHIENQSQNQQDFQKIINTKKSNKRTKQNKQKLPTRKS